MDMSLDDIIKTKKIKTISPKTKLKKTLVVRKTLNKTSFKRPIADARNKIIQKNRAKIRDARDKLAEITRSSGDARQRLLQKQRQNVLTSTSLKDNSRDKGSHYRNNMSNANAEVKRLRRPMTVNKITVPTKSIYHRPQVQNVAPARVSRMPDIVDVPRGYVDYDNMERMEEEEYASATRLSRTVKNDIAYSGPRVDVPPAPRRLNSWGSDQHFDPFDVYEVPHGRHERRMSPTLPPPPPKGILRPSGVSGRRSPDDLYERRYIPQPSSHLSYEMRSRLERAPDPHASMGIFANPLRSASLQQSSSGYRIVVSNLHTSVTQSDIRELFEDIGELYDSRIVRPGVAEVIYKSLVDAEKAVDTYHNRQLDGQPMKCLLVNPRSSNKPTAPAISTTGSSRHIAAKTPTPLEIDIDALHKVLFRRH